MNCLTIIHRLIVGILLCTTQLTFCPPAPVEVDPNECSICMDALAHGVRTTTCGHKFHDNCIAQWLVNNNHCPICRAIDPFSANPLPAPIRPAPGFATAQRARSARYKSFIRKGIVTICGAYALYLLYDLWRSKNKPSLFQKIDNDYQQSYAIDWDII